MFLKFIREHTLSLIIVIFCIIICIFYAIKINQQRECQVVYDGGNFIIVSYNGAEYIINKDIYGGGIYKKGNN